MFLLLAGRW